MSQLKVSTLNPEARALIVSSIAFGMAMANEKVSGEIYDLLLDPDFHILVGEARGLEVTADDVVQAALVFAADRAADTASLDDDARIQKLANVYAELTGEKEGAKKFFAIIGEILKSKKRVLSEMEEEDKEDDFI